MLDVITENIDIWSSSQIPKTGGGRGRSKNGEHTAHGVNKLRELILEMAVRGKLVPQDPNEEPASVLLENIVKEKAQLIKEGTIKKQKLLPKIADDEKPFKLPKGWIWTRLGNLSANLHYGYTASAEHENTGIRLLRITDIQDNTVNWINVPGCQIIEKKANDYLLENGDILIARTGGTIGKSYLVENIIVKAVFASYLIRVSKLEAMYPPFIKKYLGSQLYWKQLYENAMGTGQPNVNATSLKSLLFALPPIAEQHRIVAKVDELMTLCGQLEQQQTDNNTAHQTLVETLLGTLTTSDDYKELQENWSRIERHFDTLFITEYSIEQFKQIILQLGVMGKLVLQDPNDEPTSVLLDKIATNKTKLITEKKIKKTKLLPDISDNEKPFNLPNGWEYVRLNDLGDWGAGATPLRGRHDYYNGKIPWFKSGELISDYISDSEEYVTELALKETSLRYNKPGDVLIAMYGATIGKCSILKIPATTNQAVCACTPYHGFANKYLLTLLKAYKNRFVGMGTGGAQPNISREKIIATVIALPPLAEQQRIVAKIDELMVQCDFLKSKISETQTTQVQLADAIVEKAVAF